ncbi:MAG: DUF4417 domain-containing protein [Treponema sp.]|nr:DUF4417 domain-containing protein [Treponema sp.]
MPSQNDVMNYARFFRGTDEPPRFCHEYLNLENKLFAPTDDFKLVQKLTDNTKEDVVLYHFEYDSQQNRLLVNNLADRELHRKAFAVTSPDFSADSAHCWSCLNEANILKARICAYRWQTECDEATILTLLWGDKSTYKWAFGNVEKGTVVAVSSQGVKDISIFENGIRVGIDMIQPDQICWYGKVFDFMEKYYDTHRIVKMQTRSDLLKMYKLKCENQDQALLF